MNETVYRNDTLNGGAGNDNLTGGNGADIFVMSAGKDVITDYTSGEDKIFVEGAANVSINKGSDAVITVGKNTLTLKKLSNENPTVNGKQITFIDKTGETTKTYFNDRITDGDSVTLNSGFKGTFDAASFTVVDASSVKAGIKINGSAKNETLLGGKGSDTLNGGTGQNLLTGGNGKDIFVYGGGNDTITDYDPADKISLGSAQVQSFSVTGKDVTFNLGTNQSLTLKDAAGKKVTFAEGKKSTVNIYTADGLINSAETAITLNAAMKDFTADSKLMTIDGSLTNGVAITGNSKANLLIGGKGSDTFMGDADKDIFVVSGGNDTIIDYDPADKISLGSALIQSFSVTGKDVTFNLGTNQSLTLKDAAGKKVTFAEGKKSTVNIYTADGLINSAETAITLNAAMKDFTADSKLMTIDGSLTNGVAITGNTKANLLIGGKGSDTFIYTAGAGNDIISNYGAGDKISIVGATVTDASVKSGNTVLKVGKNSITVKNSSEVTLVDGGGEKLFSSGIFYNAGKTSATLPASFSAKGTTKLDARTIDASHVSKAVNITGNDAANSILGSVKNDTLYGGAGNDSLWGDAGADKFIYDNGDGKDIIFGFDNTDMLQITGDWSAAYVAKSKTIAFKVGDTANAITLKDFTTTLFNVNGNTYTISGSKLVKK